MKRLVLVVPGLVGEESVLRGFRAWDPLVESGFVIRAKGYQGFGLREASFLGMEPETIPDAPGPFLVAALKHDPPERSVHFVLSLLSVNEDGLVSRPAEYSDAEVAEVLAATEKLSTKRLTPLVGRGLEHGLVWEEGSLDLAICSADELIGEAWGDRLPEGDGEGVLRQFVEDSVNLLDSLEVNKRRRGEGLLPLNLLWPWGFGLRPSVPMLALRRRGPAAVYSDSWTLKGLARLVGYRSFDRKLAAGVHLREDVLDALRVDQPGFGHQVLVSPGSASMREHQRLEELEFEISQVAERVIEPWFSARESDPFVLAVLGAGLGTSDGLALVFDTRRQGDGGLPFDERVLDDPRLPSRTVAEIVEGVLTS